MNNQEKKITLFEDVIFNPIYIPDLVNIIIRFIDERYYGVFNVGSSGKSMTKAEYAKKVINKLHLKMVKVAIGRMKNVKSMIAPRPTDMSMSVNKIENNLGMQLPNLEESIEQIGIDYVQIQKKYEKRT